MKNYSIALALLSTLVSCAFNRVDVEHKIPSSMALSPETTGKNLAGEVALAGQTAAKESVIRGTQLSSTISSESDVQIDRTPTMDPTAVLSARGKLGIFERLDLALMLPSNLYPALFGAQFQFFGSPEYQREPGFKASVYGFIGEGTLEYDAERAGGWFEGEPEDDRYNDLKGRSEVQSIILGTSIGQRVSQKAILYFTAQMAETQSDSSVVDSTRNITYSVDHESYLYSGIAGVKGTFNAARDPSSFFFQAEIGRSMYKTAGVKKSYLNQMLLSLGFSWGGTKYSSMNKNPEDDENDDDENYEETDDAEENSSDKKADPTAPSNAKNTQP